MEERIQALEERMHVQEQETAALRTDMAVFKAELPLKMDLMMSEFRTLSGKVESRFSDLMNVVQSIKNTQDAQQRTQDAQQKELDAIKAEPAKKAVTLLDKFKDGGWYILMFLLATYVVAKLTVLQVIPSVSHPNPAPTVTGR